MRIEMNIGLNVVDGNNSDTAVMDRACRAVSLLAESLYFGRVDSRVTQTTYTGPDGQSTTERVLLTTAVLRAPMRDALDMVDYLSKRLKQECIAVGFVNDDTGTLVGGELIGPGAARWGAFDRRYFVRFDAVATAIQEAA